MPVSKKSKTLFLASSLDKTIDQFVTLLNLEPAKNRVAFVETASIPYGNPENFFWVSEDKQAFVDKGFRLEVFDFTKLTTLDLETKLTEFDIIHFCGGNTLYLNYLLHKTGFGETVKQKVLSENLIYTGTSAGSMVVAPDLFEIKNSLTEDIDLKFLEGIARGDYIGLNLVPFLIIPHTNNADFVTTNQELVQKLPNYKYPLIFLQDNQAIFVQNDKFEIIEKT